MLLEEIREIQGQAGWTVDTVMMLLAEFIEERGAALDLKQWLRARLAEDMKADAAA